MSALDRARYLMDELDRLRTESATPDDDRRYWATRDELVALEDDPVAGPEIRGYFGR